MCTIFVEERDHLDSMFLWNQMQRLFVHRADGQSLLALRAGLLPREAVETSLIDSGIPLRVPS